MAPQRACASGRTEVNRWVVTEENGRVTVTVGRKTETFGSMAEALAYVKKNAGPRDKVVQVEEDGYETPLVRRHWRA